MVAELGGPSGMDTQAEQGFNLPPAVRRHYTPRRPPLPPSWPSQPVIDAKEEDVTQSHKSLHSKLFTVIFENCF